MERIEECKDVFFLGVGGIGMSAIARYLKFKGINVSGYDRDSNELTKKLEAEGISIHYEDDVSLLPDNIDLIIYTPAIPSDNAEFVYLKQTGIPMLKRSEALKNILAEKKVIAVAGTHGKTSTSAILAHILHSQGFGSSAFIGGLMKNYHSNFLYGNGPWVVVEADEYDRSFLRLHPDIAVIQALDADHLDIYGERQQLLDSFKEFTLQIKEGGTLWMRDNLSDFWQNDNWQKGLESQSVAISGFGEANGDNKVHVSNVSPEGHFVKFELTLGNDKVICHSKMRGFHNVINATAAAAVAFQLGLEPSAIADGISSFEGIERRFELVYEDAQRVLIDDYAHHPVEIDAAVEAVRSNYPDKKLLVIFQPHLFSRTRDFKEGFAAALDKADEVILLDIYPAREKPINGVDSGMIKSLMKMKNNKWLSKDEMINSINKNAKGVILILGAGDINKLIPRIKEKFV
jgi:UDP-N-acetylmuramate--alanine ligase